MLVGEQSQRYWAKHSFIDKKSLVITLGNSVDKWKTTRLHVYLTTIVVTLGR